MIKNFDSNTMNLKTDIACSVFYNCYVGIIRDVRKTDWTTTPNIDPGLNFSNITQWNIIWSELIQGTMNNKMMYYSSNGAPYPNPLWAWEDLNKPAQSLFLDDVLVSYNNFSDNDSEEKSPFFDNTRRRAILCSNNNHYFVQMSEESITAENKSGFKIYPNPTNDILNIELDKGIDYLSIEIFNFMGQKVYETSTTEKLVSITMRDYPMGIYIVKVIQDGVTYSQKVIKH
jgi:hypothetical protein